MTSLRRLALLGMLLGTLLGLLASCKAEPRNIAAVEAYYRYDFVTARESLRHDALLAGDNQTILNNTRLGIASLADGDLNEAERALGTSFDLLSTAGLNKDKTVAAVLDHEGVRIWKGEPFEQALTYHYVSLLYALKRDWENVRAAAANSLFRLTDFGTDHSAETLARNAAGDDAYLERGYTAVDTNFALGFIMQAIGSDLSGASGAKEQFNAALTINSDLRPIVERLQSRDYDTLLVVDYGRGPMKQAYGADDAFVHFVPLEEQHGQLIVAAGGNPLARANPVCDVNDMAQDHRWNNLEDVRRAKSALGTALLAGGAIATAYGADQEEGEAALAGIGAMALGLLTKAGARADTRYCEFMPQAVYLVPLSLGRPTDVDVEIAGRPQARIHLNNVRPGTQRDPLVIYLRLFRDGGGGDVSWLTARREVYSNDITGIGRGPAAYPWILGGRDVSTPSPAALDAYQAAGALQDCTVAELLDLYASEGLVIGSGMENRRDVPKDPSFRHVLEGGSGLFTPHAHSMGYQRIMCSRQPAYRPRTELVRKAADTMRVLQQEQRVAAADDGAAAASHQQEPAEQ